METLVVVAQHRNQYYGRSRAHGPARFGSYGSPPSRDIREMNCRTFHSGAGICKVYCLWRWLIIPSHSQVLKKEPIKEGCYEACSDGSLSVSCSLTRKSFVELYAV
ncbi:hypothetical protein F0562_021247 [Nyssa sinensis]|uniref:Uncharacterized protein n=1 Tax=Nyssa sinensis TaxID=561372 RepID=A0A5J5BKT9_9ASTE|nr:hypothetical protein F0562_021247 [Nyssa sinensis]